MVAATAPRVAAFILLPVYAFELSPGDLAAYGVSVSLAQFIGIVSDAGIVNGMMRTCYDYPEGRERDVYLKSTVLLSRIVAAINLVPIAGLLALAWGALFQGTLQIGIGLPLILAFAFLLRGNTLAGVYYRLRRKHKLFSSTKMLPAAIQVVAGLLFVFVLHWGAVGAISAAPIGFACSILVSYVRARAEDAKAGHLSRVQIRRLVTTGAPIITDELARWAQLLSLRPLLALFAPIRETAAFTFSNAPAQVIVPFSEAAELYLSPLYYEACRRRDETRLSRLRDLTSLFVGVGSLITILSLLLFGPLFAHLAPLPYRAAGGLAAVSIAGMVLREQLALMVHNLRQDERGKTIMMVVLTGMSASYGEFFLFVGQIQAWAAAIAIYLYPVAASCAALLGLAGTRFRFVRPNHLIVANAAVLAVLLTMLLPDWLALQPGLYWSLLVGMAAAATALIGVLVIMPPALRELRAWRRPPLEPALR